MGLGASDREGRGSRTTSTTTPAGRAQLARSSGDAQGRPACALRRHSTLTHLLAPALYPQNSLPSHTHRHAYARPSQHDAAAGPAPPPGPATDLQRQRHRLPTASGRQASRPPASPCPGEQQQRRGHPGGPRPEQRLTVRPVLGGDGEASCAGWGGAGLRVPKIRWGEECTGCPFRPCGQRGSSDGEGSVPAPAPCRAAALTPPLTRPPAG